MDAVSLAAACGAAGDACAGGRRLPAWRPHCSGVGPGGGFGDLGALCLWVGVTAGPGGLGSWLVCRREHGLVHALGPGSGVGVFDASVPPQGGGSNRGGVNGLYLGVLLSYVVWELTGWWGGVVFPLLWGLVGRPGLPWALVWMGLGPPPGQIWGNGGAYGGQRGSWLQRGGYFAPSDAFLPIPKASLLPAPSHQHIGRVLRCGCVAGMRGRWYSSVSSWPPASQLHITA